MYHSRINLRRVFSLLPLAMVAAALTACGSGGGGGGGGSVLATGGFTKTFGPADDNNNSYPFNFTDQKVQLLYTAAEINGSGNITALRFRRSSATGQQTCPNTTIRLGHTSLAALTTTFGNNVEEGRGSQITVVNDATVTIPAGSAATWFEIPLTTAFNYNGVDNLVVEVERTTACSATIFTDVYTAASDRRAHSSAPDATSGVADHNQTTANGADAIQNWMQFVFSGGDNGVLYPNAVGNAYPFTPIAAGQHVQMLHLASDINGSGPVTGIAMISNESPTDAASYTVNITLGHTSLTALTDTFADNFDSGTPVAVATALTFNVPAGVPAGTPIWLPITGSFNYNGTDNLIVDIEVSNAVGNTLWRLDNTLPGQRVFGAVGNPTGTVGSGGYHTAFRFHGGSMGLITDGNLFSVYPFNGASDPKTQALYRATELGTGGQITKVACRLNSATSTATDYPNFEVVLGHTDLTELTATFADNMDDATTVFSGTFSLPAGLVQGDWIEIPLSTPFTYDPARNLVVQYSSDAGGNTHPCTVSSTDFTRFPNRNTVNADRTQAMGTQNNNMYDLKVDYSK